MLLRPNGRIVIPTFEVVVKAVGRAIDVAGVVAIAGGIALVLALAARSTTRGESGIYGRFRQQLGRVILLGLELLVAADIIRTVAVAPTLGSVVVLGVIVIVRTFLSFSLEVELTGHWPWQRNSNLQARNGGPPDGASGHSGLPHEA